MAQYKLLYENSTLYGVHLPKLMFHLKNIEYEEEKVDSTARLKERESESFYGALLLLHKGKMVAQQRDIPEYLAGQFDLLGETDEQKKTCGDIMLKVFCLMCSIRGYSTHEPKIKEQIAKDMIDKHIPEFLVEIEELLKISKFSSGYLIGEKLTWCDLGLALTFLQFQKVKRKKPNIMDNYPLVNAFGQKVMSIPAVKDYVTKEFGHLLTIFQKETVVPLKEKETFGQEEKEEFPHQAGEELIKNKETELQEEKKEEYPEEKQEENNVREVEMICIETEELHFEEKEEFPHQATEELVKNKVTELQDEKKEEYPEEKQEINNVRENKITCNKTEELHFEEKEEFAHQAREELVENKEIKLQEEKKEKYPEKKQEENINGREAEISSNDAEELYEEINEELHKKIEEEKDMTIDVESYCKKEDVTLEEDMTIDLEYYCKKEDVTDEEEMKKRKHDEEEKEFPCKIIKKEHLPQEEKEAFSARNDDLMDIN